MCTSGRVGVGGAGAGAPVTRRRFLVVGAAAAGTLVAGRMVRAGAAQPAVDLGGVAVIPRSAWGGDLGPTAAMPLEPEVRFLLVHHSVDPGNDYGAGDVAGVLRGFVRYHTGAKGWPDLAYNFLVDRFGRVWEGRTGSLDGPVAGDATGGNQGFDQLCCFIGNHQAGRPSPEAFAAMARLLGALGRRYGISLAPDATATFVSRGSNRHPAGAEVTTATVAGHRDMSRTQCPGDLVAARLPELRSLAAGGGSAPAPSPTAPAGTAPSTAAPPTTARPVTTTGPVASPPTVGASSGAVPSSGGDGGTGPAAAVAGGATAAAAVAAGSVWARRRHSTPPAGPG